MGLEDLLTRAAFTATWTPESFYTAINGAKAFVTTQALVSVSFLLMMSVIIVLLMMSITRRFMFSLLVMGLLPTSTTTLATHLR